ncbi:MAG: hypothetical protein ACD_52C00119G0002, partial [uncultured bacterium]
MALISSSGSPILLTTSVTAILSSTLSSFSPVITTLFTLPISEDPAKETASTLSFTLTV